MFLRLLLFPLRMRFPLYRRLQARETRMASPGPAESCLPARGAAKWPLCQLCWLCPIPRQWSHPSAMPSGESLQRGCATLPDHIGRSVTSALVCASSSQSGSGRSCMGTGGTCQLHLRAGQELAALPGCTQVLEKEVPSAGCSYSAVSLRIWLELAQDRKFRANP